MVIDNAKGDKAKGTSNININNNNKGCNDGATMENTKEVLMETGWRRLWMERDNG